MKNHKAKPKRFAFEKPKGEQTRLQRFVIWLSQFVPVSRGRMERAIAEAKTEHAKQVADIRRRHEREVDETAKQVDKIIKRCSCIEFRREQGDQYALMLRFDPRMVLGGACTSDELRFIARRVAYQVEGEIATARFIQSASDLERQRFARLGFFASDE